MRSTAQLFSDGELILLQIKQCERKIACKLEADARKTEARFFPNPYSPVSFLLSEPLSFYEQELARLQLEKSQISEQLTSNLNATDHRSYDLRKSL